MKNIPATDFFIFDLGNVIIDIHYPETIAYIKTHVAPALHSRVDQFYLTDFHLNYEKGLISTSEFRREVRAYFETNWSDDFVDHLWNSLLGKIPSERLALVQKLRKKHKVGVLSNTNEIHVNAVYQILKNHHGVNNLSDLFDHVFLSHEMSLAKPDPKIYRTMLQNLQTTPERVTFFDDLAANVTAAKQLGIHAIQVTNPQVIFDYLSHV
ncbi:HAD family hydrolase [Algoriphagus namhaensis]